MSPVHSQGTFKENLEIAKQVADHSPYGDWLKNSHRLSEFAEPKWLTEPVMSSADVLKLQAANGKLAARTLHAESRRPKCLSLNCMQLLI